MSQERFVLFWKGPFSQWARSVFELNGFRYVNAEQYMMAEKARFFGDKEIEIKIMESRNPREIKRLGREVRNFDKQKWDSVARDVVYRGNHAKFFQNPDLYEHLMDTGEATLVEASPYDEIWGIGLNEYDPLTQSRETWRGTNWLGEVLTKVRNDLRSGTESAEFDWA